MKIIFGIIAALIGCLISTPAQAANFGLSPAAVDYQIERGESKTIEFTVVGYSGAVDINSENMPVSVFPSSINVVAGSTINVIIKCNSNATEGIYDGKIVFLAKSGSSVMSGIKVKCNLKVGNSSSSATYSSAGSVESPISNSGAIIGAGSSNNNVIVSLDSVFVPLAPSVLPSVQIQAQENNVPVDNKGFNWLFFVAVVVVGMLFVGAFVIGYKWSVNRKKI